MTTNDDRYRDLLFIYCLDGASTFSFFLQGKKKKLLNFTFNAKRFKIKEFNFKKIIQKIFKLSGK